MAIPDALVKEAQALLRVYPFYRSATELFIAGGRKVIKELIDIIHKKKEILEGG